MIPYVLLNKYCSGHQIEKNEMGGACITCGEMIDAYRILVWRPEGRSQLGRPRLRWEDNHHHKHQGLDPLIRSVSRVIVALSNVF